MDKKKKNPSEKQDLLEGFSGSIERDYDADADETTANDDVIVVDLPHVSHKETIHKVLSFVLGLIIIAFAIIGVVTTSISAANFFGDIASNKALREEFELYLYPVVATDMPKFESAENLPSSTVITASISKILLTGDTTKYENEYGMIYIPDFDIESAASSLFGSNVKVTHDTVRFGQHIFSYYPERQVYGVYESSNIANYAPKIVDIKNVGETYTLIVDYYPPTVSIAGLDKKSEAAKTMIYTIIKTGDKKTITAIDFGFNDYED